MYPYTTEEQKDFIYYEIAAIAEAISECSKTSELGFSKEKHFYDLKPMTIVQ